MEDKNNVLSEEEKKELIKKYKAIYGPDYVPIMTLAVIIQLVAFIISIVKK